MPDLSAQDQDSLISEISTGLGLHADSSGSLPADWTNFLGDELDAFGGTSAGLDGFTLEGVNTKDFMALVKNAETFAGITGWKYFPNGNTLKQMASNPPQGGWDANSTYKALYGALPKAAQAQYPNAKFGLSNADYWSTANSYMDQMEALTGTRSLPSSLINQAIDQNWSAQRMTSYLQQNSWVQNQFGWVKHNMNFQAWNQYKEDNRQAIAGRFGDAAVNSDSSYLQNLNDPLQQFKATESGTPKANAQNQGWSTLSTYASEAR